ncbi:uncharacterized protein LOC143289524 isoform X2 [Babylonia areolata]|uniref:uncharacterized protein LOC143289524 isoform X2 n=1 Tax=Babylonia areolata TaxID=304850 RepID=UPI003FD04FB1
MPSRTSDTVVGVIVLTLVGIALALLTFHGGRWVINSLASEDSSSSSSSSSLKNSPTLHEIYKKGLEEGVSASSGDPRSENEEGKQQQQQQGQQQQEEGGGGIIGGVGRGGGGRGGGRGRRGDPSTTTIDLATVDAIVARLAEKLEAGEISLGPDDPGCACACDQGGQGRDQGQGQGQDQDQGQGGGGGCRGTRRVVVTHVINVTRLQYQCLVGDDVRWAVLAKELKEVMAEETDAKVARWRTEAEGWVKDLNHTTVARLVELRKEMEEARERRLAQTEQRLRDIEQRLALGAQLMEVQGFLKIDTVGPILLALGAVEVLVLLCVCLLFARQR